MTEYRIFLDAVAKNQILSINNFAAMTISEDKEAKIRAFLQALRLLSVQASLSRYERSVVDAYIPETFLLEDSRVVTQGLDVNLLSHLEVYQDEFVLKPRSDYRGSGVYSGRDCTKDEWKNIIKGNIENNYLAQRRVDCAECDVAYEDDDDFVRTAPMRMAGGVYFANSDFQGLLARVSKAEVINIAKGAFVLPIYVTDD